MDSDCSVPSTPTDDGHGDYRLDNNGDHSNKSPELLNVPMKLQMEKAFAAEEPRRPQTKTSTTMNLGPQRQIPMDYFCRHKMDESHVHDVCFANRTISPDEKAGLLPKQLGILYEERQHMMDWVLGRLERIIWKYARGEKMYKKGETGPLVEQFRDIQLAWKLSGTYLMYNKLFHSFIGQFDMTPDYFNELSREYMGLPEVWWEYDTTKVVLVKNKRDSSLKTIATAQRAKLVYRIKNSGKKHSKRLTITLTETTRANKGRWAHILKGIPLPPLVHIESCAAILNMQKVSPQ
jgi:hypothetical protein